ncbi:MAG: LuxR C-terminal-related transcriptional regulator [Planctomycetes bacterium]|nr:LuxR C-terminal-related transcriptional regulator [Planctomycetota bacterium]
MSGDAEPPDLPMIFEEEHRRLVSLLRDDTLREIVRWKIDGYSNRRIAEILGISEHSVGRKIRLIRMIWSEELTS